MLTQMLTTGFHDFFTETFENKSQDRASTANPKTKTKYKNTFLKIPLIKIKVRKSFYYPLIISY